MMRSGASRTTAGPRRRGGIYVLVLGAATLLSVLALTSLAVLRVNLRTTVSAADTVAAREYARSGIEAVIGWTTTTPDWRDQYVAFASLMPMAFDRGHCDVDIYDEDGSSPLTTTSEQRVRIISTGDVYDGPTPAGRWVYAVYARQPGLPALATAAHAAGNVLVASGATAIAEDGPLSSSGQLRVAGTLRGDVQAAIIQMAGVLIGDQTILTAPLEMPAAGVFDIYKGAATTMNVAAVAGTIDKRLISPNSNPFGSLNANGLYRITHAGEVTIRNSRIVGTLVVDVTGGTRLRIQEGVHWKPARPDYPALIIKGDLHLESDRDLSELVVNVNLNPAATPFEGLSDASVDDTYGSAIHGLIHQVGSTQKVYIRNTMHVEGCVLAEGTLEIQNQVHLMADPNLALNPPRRYRTTGLAVERGSWTRRVD